MQQNTKLSLLLILALSTACQMPIQNQEDPSRMLSILTGKDNEPKTVKPAPIPEIKKDLVIDVLAGKTEARFWLQYLMTGDSSIISNNLEIMRDLDQRQRKSPDLDDNCAADVLTYLGCYQSLSALSLHFDELLVEPSIEKHFQKYFPDFRYDDQVHSNLALGDFKIIKIKKANLSFKDAQFNSELGFRNRQEWTDKILLFSILHQQKNPNSLALKNSISTPPWSKLIHMYLDRLSNQVTDKTIRNEVFIEAMSKYLQARDSFAHVTLQEEQKKALNSADTTFTGLGIEIEIINRQHFVKTVIEGSGADLAGIKVGDQILAVAGVSMIGASFAEFRKLAIGAENSNVLVKIQRLQVQQELTVTRKKVVFFNVTKKEFGKAQYVKVNTFMDASENGLSLSSKFTKILEEVQKSNQTAIIIDLRNNGGGLLYEALQMLSPIVSSRLNNGVLLYEKSSEDLLENDVKVYRLPKVQPLNFTKQVIVLINDQSASASEVFAGTIQAVGAGWVVGQKSFGKGSVQTLSQGILPQMLVGQTTGYYYFTNEISPHVDGITPDFMVATEKTGPRLQDLKPAEISQNTKVWSNPRRAIIEDLRRCTVNQSHEFMRDEELKFALNLLNCLPANK